MQTVFEFQLHFWGDDSFESEATQALQDAGIEVRKPPRMRSASPMDIIVALGSAGAFTALYQVICKLLDKKERALTIERGDTKISLKGCSLQEMKELLEQLAPELLTETRSKRIE